MSKPKSAAILAEGEIDYRSLFRVLPTGYFIIEAAEPHRFLEANEAHFAMTGRSADIIGKPLFEIYPDVSEAYQQTEHSTLHESIDKVVHSGKPDALDTFRYDIPDGKGNFLVRFWRPTHYPIFDDKGNVNAVLQTSEDITEKTMTENDLKYRQWQLEETLGMGMIGTWQWDTESDLVIADKNLARAFGIDIDRASIGIPLETFTNSIHPDDRERVVKAIARALKKKGPFEQEYRTINADGNALWVLARGKVEEDRAGTLMFPGVLVEITARKKAEELLRYQALITDSIDDAVISLDLKGKVTGWNKGAAKLFGYTEKQAVGSASEDILVLAPGYDRVKIRQTAYSGGSWRGNLVYHHKDGHPIKVIASVSALRDDSGDSIGLVTIMQDLTQINKAQSEAQKEKAKARAVREEAKLLKEQNEQLLALSRTKDEFIALTSHQLRTPATGTKQYLGMLLEGYAEPLGPRQRSFLQSAYDCNERQLRVVDDILRVAQVDLDKTVLRKEPTNIGMFIRQIVDEQTGKLERRDHVIEYQQPTKPIQVALDRDRLRMAIENIIDNADKYTEPGKRIAIRIVAARDHVDIEIEDEGVGINTTDHTKLFQKFSRIDNPLSVEVGGSGLGLYWSKRIIELHEGAISLSSELDKGTTFIITLPVTARQKIVEPSPEVSGVPAAG